MKLSGMPRKKLWGIFVVPAIFVVIAIFMFFVPVDTRNPLGRDQWLCAAANLLPPDDAMAHEAAHEKFHLLLGELSAYRDAGKTISTQRFIDYSCNTGTDIVYKLYL